MKNDILKLLILMAVCAITIFCVIPDEKHKQEVLEVDIPEEIVDTQNIINYDSLYLVAVDIIKKYEGWHSKKHYPYVGYGHKLSSSDNFNSNITEEFATEILKKDLNQKISVFKEFGKDSLILGVLSYNIGEYKIKGGYGYKESSLIKAIKENQPDSVIKKLYTQYRVYNGKVVKSIEKRRNEEFENLYICLTNG